jgi:putative SOS response-associated peptidase YedK
MCGRFVQASDPDGIMRFMVVDDRVAADLPPRYNVAPTDETYAVVDHDGRRTLVTFRWGLVPRWATDRTRAASLINARAETVADKPAFRESFASKRCLIPADGFYEWTAAADGGRQPHYIHRVDRTPLALAGLWSGWRDPADDTVVRTCAIVTTAAGLELAALHDRMPLVLDAEVWDDWLDPANPAPAHLLAAAAPPLAFHPVGRAVNRTGVDHPDLISPLDPDPEAGLHRFNCPPG